MIAPELQALLDQPIGDRSRPTDYKGHCPDQVDAARRANKLWLPLGTISRRDVNRAAAADALERQFDLEAAVEAAGGHRGSVAA